MMGIWVLVARRTSKIFSRGYTAPHCRSVHTAPGKELKDMKPRFLPFELTADEAKERYCTWQQNKWLTPSNLLSQGKYTMKPVMLPYWIFNLKAKVQFMGTVGTKKHQGDRGSVLWRDVGWTTIDKWNFPSEEPQMQVHASFQFRRDFADAMKGNVALSDLHPMLKSQAEVQEIQFSGIVDGPVALPLPEMRKAIAWEFALRGAHEIAVKHASERLKEIHEAEVVKNVNVVISPLSRHASLIYLPAYSLSYFHGEEHNVHGERQPKKFYGLISGLRNGGIAGERHISIHKASSITGGVTLGAMGMLSVVSPLVGADPFIWTSFDFMFSALTMGATAGLIAQMAPGLLAMRADNKRFDAEVQSAAAAAASSGGSAPPNFEQVMDREEVHRTNLEWMRWEESDKRAWDAEKRQRWAQQLWEAQHSRRRERRRRQQQAQREQARRQSEEIREKRRRSRWGRQNTPHHFSHDFLRGGSRFDFKGYYEALGLDPTAGHVSQDDIKKAFREAAMQWHPDRHADAGGKEKARDRFHKVRTAYETLRDPERRKNYDLGQIQRQ